MVVCVLVPRFSLTVAVGGRAALTRGPLVLAPEPGRDPVVGEPSAAAEAYGVVAGMRLGEAMARCPELALVAPDPAGVADAHDAMLSRLEALGAAVESGPPGVACFEERGLRSLHGGSLDGVLAAAREAIGGPARLGAAPVRFAAQAAAARARARHPEVAPRERPALARWLAGEPVALLALRPSTAHLVAPLARFGVRTLGELAALPLDAVSDRFGEPGVHAHGLARGRDTPLRARELVELIEEHLSLPEAASGQQLERALELLVDRILAHPERRGRPLRAVVLTAVLVEGGTWRRRLTFREALADPRRMRLVLAPRLAELPAPASSLALRAEGFGAPGGDQRSLIGEPARERAARLREAIRQARSVAGPEAALRILAVDPDSRVPERRLVLTPWEV